VPVMEVDTGNLVFAVILVKLSDLLLKESTALSYILLGLLSLLLGRFSDCRAGIFFTNLGGTSCRSAAMACRKLTPDWSASRDAASFGATNGSTRDVHSTCSKLTV
jgi:hypothetical protein